MYRIHGFRWRLGGWGAYTQNGVEKMGWRCKQRRCVDCGCNTLIRCEEYDDETIMKRRNIRYFCIDCDEEVQTELYEMDWRDEKYKRSNSASITKMKTRLERARENIKRMSDSIERMLTQ